MDSVKQRAITEKLPKTAQSQQNNPLPYGGNTTLNNMNNQEQPNDKEVKEYQARASSRNEATALLAELKAREDVAVSKVFWKDGQPTLVESTSKTQWEQRLINRGFVRPETKGLPATESGGRVASGWESKLERKRRSNFTLDETPTMAFKSSGHLPVHYYQDESAIEAYIESLKK